ncbi:unnamed protein product [Rhodiola kirilowii]
MAISCAGERSEGKRPEIESNSRGKKQDEVGDQAASTEEQLQQGKGADLANRNKSFWAAKTQASRNRERGATLQFFAQVQGADRVVIPKEEWVSAAEKFKNALVGFVFGAKPLSSRMKRFVRAKWGDESVVKVSSLNDGIFLLNFAEEARKMEVILGGPWTFDNRPLILKHWSEHEDYKCGSIESLPVWVTLPGIKAHVSDLTILSRICSVLGIPICTDGVTADGSSYGYARVCVEVFGDVELLDRIEYEDPYGNCYVQPVLYEWRPPRCTNCCNFGHLKEMCPEPNFEAMLAAMKEKEIQMAKEKDKREAAEDLDNIEVVEEETPADVTAESATSVPVQHTSNFTPKLEDSLPQAATTKISEEGKPQFNIGGASVPPTSGFSLNLENAAVSEQNEQSSFGGVVFGEAKSVPNNQPEQPVSAIDGSSFTEKTEASGNAGYQEDEMEEEAPEASHAAEIKLGSLGGFGLGSSTPTTPNRNPFGGSLGNPSASPASSPFTMSSSGGEFRPASFSFSPTQLQQTTSQPAATSFGGFGSSTTPAGFGFGFAANQAPSGGGFGQPAQVGQGQQALGSVLSSFGQSRQNGIGQPANSFAPVSGFGSGFAGSQSTGGFSNAATKSGGFAALASNSGGFAAAASAATGGFATAHSGGFAGVAAPTGGFSGFAGAAGSGGGFGAAGGGGFGQQGSSFSAFGGTGAQPPAQFFTQMRK